MDYKKFYNQLMSKDFKPKPQTFFTSDEYKKYSEVQVGAVVSTAVDYIRNVLHFDIPQYEIMRRSSVPVIVQYDENGKTAYTTGSKIVMNAANSLVKNYQSIYMQHASLQGMLRHETAHILFTDTSLIADWYKALVFGKMLHQPDNVKTPDGKEIIKRLADDPIFAGVFAKLAKHIENSIEDGYIEAELDTVNDGMGDTIRYLATTNAAMIEQAMAADGFNYKSYDSKFDAVTSFILMYAKYGYEFENVPANMEPLFNDLKKIIKECISSRVPTTRMTNINKLLITMYPVLKERIEDMSNQINNQMQSGGSSGQSGNSKGQGGKGSGSSGESGQSGSSESNSGDEESQDGSMDNDDTVLIRSDKNTSEQQNGQSSQSDDDDDDDSDEGNSSKSSKSSGKKSTDKNTESGSDSEGSDSDKNKKDTRKGSSSSGSKDDGDDDKGDDSSSDKSDSGSSDKSSESKSNDSDKDDEKENGNSGAESKDKTDSNGSSEDNNASDSNGNASSDGNKKDNSSSGNDEKSNGAKSENADSDKDSDANGDKDDNEKSSEPKKMTKEEADKINKEIDAVSKNVPSADDNDCTSNSCVTSSIFNRNNVAPDSKNNGGENVRQQAQQEVGKNPKDKEIRNIPGGSNAPEKSAYDDVSSIISEMQKVAAAATTEKKRELDLQMESKELVGKYKDVTPQRDVFGRDALYMKEYFIRRLNNINITRVVTPPQNAEAVYQGVAGAIKSVSRPTQREIIKAIRDKRKGYKLTGLTMGRRVEASLIHHNDGKCFSKSKSPEDTPELCVGVLLDQSGSTRGEIINYERLLAMTIEDMCRSIEIPAIINGYCGNGAAMDIISYVEPNSVDRKNALRLTAMYSSGGTPTGEALAYMLNRLEKRPEPAKILFVVTDGQSDNKAYLPMLLAEAKRNHIMVIAAGIGSCRQSIHSEFPENFLDISDMRSMPRNICNIIKRKLMN